jgi:hypothetical protein
MQATEKKPLNAVFFHLNQCTSDNDDISHSSPAPNIQPFQKLQCPHEHKPSIGNRCKPVIYDSSQRSSLPP